MTPLEIAMEALEEIVDSTIVTGVDREGFCYSRDIANEALGNIRRAQYLEGQTPSGRTCMKEKL